MNHPTRQRRHPRQGAIFRAVLTAMVACLLGHVASARADVDSWLTAEVARTLEIAPPSEGPVEIDETEPVVLGSAWASRLYVTPMRLARSWRASALRVRLDRAGSLWESRPVQVRTMAVGKKLADVQTNTWPNPPTLAKTDMYLSRALQTARAGQWGSLAAEMGSFCIDTTAVTQPAAEKPKDTPSMDASFGGELDPEWSEDFLARKVKRMQSLGFDVPIVPIRSLQGDWRNEYDAFFAAIDGKATPMLGLCIGQMTLPDLLTVPEFLRRYEGKYHSIIVNYDLTNGNVDMTQAPVTLRDATDRVALALVLVHRASPSAFVWLAVGYHRSPSWESWVRSFDRQQFSGVLLSGGSAVAACMYPQTAKTVHRSMHKKCGAMPLGLIDFRLHDLDELLYHQDDLGIQRYKTIQAAMKRAGIHPMHIRYTAGH